MKEEEQEIIESWEVEDLERRMGWDGDWSKVVDQYDGTR